MASHPLFQVNVACDKFAEPRRGRVTFSILEAPRHEGLGMDRRDLPDQFLSGQVDDAAIGFAAFFMSTGDSISGTRWLRWKGAHLRHRESER